MHLHATDQTPNPKTSTPIPRLRKSLIYYEKVSVGKICFSDLHVKSGLVCPKLSQYTLKTTDLSDQKLLCIDLPTYFSSHSVIRGTVEVAGYTQ